MCLGTLRGSEGSRGAWLMPDRPLCARRLQRGSCRRGLSQGSSAVGRACAQGSALSLLLHPGTRQGGSPGVGPPRRARAAAGDSGP